MTKICFTCKKNLPFDNFTTDRKQKDGKYPTCKQCHHEIRKVQYRKRLAQGWKPPARTEEQRLKYLNTTKENNNKYPEKFLLKRAKERSKMYSLPFNIELSDVIIPEYCPILGIKLERGKEKLADGSPTIDKIIPELGYVKGNIAVISWRANKIKTNGSLDELEKIVIWLKRVLNVH